MEISPFILHATLVAKKQVLISVYCAILSFERALYLYSGIMLQARKHYGPFYQKLGCR
jgi:hypothetical protein